MWHCRLSSTARQSPRCLARTCCPVTWSGMWPGPCWIVAWQSWSPSGQQQWCSPGHCGRLEGRRHGWLVECHRGFPCRDSDWTYWNRWLHIINLLFARHGMLVTVIIDYRSQIRGQPSKVLLKRVPWFAFLEMLFLVSVTSYSLACLKHCVDFNVL